MNYMTKDELIKKLNKKIDKLIIAGKTSSMLCKLHKSILQG